ncbi:hypothetical protein [Streptomyces sp. 5-10]|uniref:hypothetical protein n=1 Tax=Streptomyces sp. 5-10 TaxID=878925 RepID=UPI00168AD0FC|nr:hypothetical protein [Streptomyces sp. 5-10]MBD3008924.1 hypothetical protein [Streptomyces sp. 5-10]
MVRTLRHTAHALVTAVAVLLALFIAADSASAQVIHPETVSVTASADSRPATDSLVSAHGDHGIEDCKGLRGRAPLSAPTPSGKYGCVCGCDAGVPVPRTAISAPITGRQAVPVSRSGELPVILQIFRC